MPRTILHEAPDALAARFARLGIRRDIDLLLHLPLRHEDETRVHTIRDAAPGSTVVIEALLTHSELSTRGRRRQMIARFEDDSDSLYARWFHFYPGLQKQLLVGTRWRLVGEVRDGPWGREMVHPRLRSDKTPLPQSLTAIYPTTAGLTQEVLRRWIGRALTHLPMPDLLPPALLAAFGLPAFASALQQLHQPPAGSPGGAQMQAAWRRIFLEELIAQQIALRAGRLSRSAVCAPVLDGRCPAGEKLRQSLGFELTAAQQRALDEIEADLARPEPMQRLLQGDVGSGKTIVAVLAMLRVIDPGWQAALMAPTEILAEQHYNRLQQWLAPLDIEVAWLRGGRRTRARRELVAALQAGEIQLAVGTHALLEEEVALPRLALAVVDEQHRFGVHQRLALRQKTQATQMAPHLLMMSATPIPRTLAMTHYADLDNTVIDALPPGRTPVQTRLVSDARRAEVIERLHAGCQQGAQAYWVCPLIEESEALQLKTACETHALLCEQLPDLKIGLVHGRLKSDEKAALMRDFVSGHYHVLVATTVIEVGVDVPNASMMVIEHAERFGLAQLHQLRGRVGRGSRASACILLYAQPLSELARARLKVLYEQNDGFEVARYDLEIRGPGEFVGARQSGVPLLRHADLVRDQELIEPARQWAEKIFADNPAAARELATRWFGEYEKCLQV